MTYVMCDNAVEYDIHMFFGCAHYKDCWNATNLWSEIRLEVPELFFNIVAGLHANEKSFFAAMFYSIWLPRNYVLSEQKLLMQPSGLHPMLMKMWFYLLLYLG